VTQMRKPFARVAVAKSTAAGAMASAVQNTAANSYLRRKFEL
jgi:hypothetical protein